PFETSFPQQQGQDVFRIIDHELDGAKRSLLQRMPAGSDWKAEYSLSADARQMHDFSEMCVFHQPSPESHFKQKTICSLARTDGRIALSDGKLIQTINGVREERVVRSMQEFGEILRDHFGISRPGHSHNS